MISLTDSRWADFKGGYRYPYDASIPLRQLELAKTEEEINTIFEEFWNELHHQGDVDIASYLSVPHILRIAIDKKIISYHVFGFVSTIEIERHRNNPALPKEFEDWYIRSLSHDIPKLAALALPMNWDLTLSSTILASLAVSKGHHDMADVILKMEDPDITNEFLENF